MEPPDKTVYSIVQFFEKLITDFSWPRLSFVVAFLVIVVGGFFVYEKYTGSFELTRLDREAAILERVLALQKSAQDITDKDLLASLENLKARLRGFSQPQLEGAVLSPSAKKALYAALPWVLLILVLQMASGPSSKAVAGVMIFAVPLVLLSVYLPDFESQWINYYLIPWGGCLAMVAFVMVWQKTKKGKAASS
jgi:hypothetical protein